MRKYTAPTYIPKQKSSRKDTILTALAITGYVVVAVTIVLYHLYVRYNNGI